MFRNEKLFFVFFLVAMNFFVVEIFAEQTNFDANGDEFVEPMKRFLLGKKNKTTTVKSTTAKSGGGAIAALITTSKAPAKTVKPLVTPKTPSISTKGSTRFDSFRSFFSFFQTPAESSVRVKTVERVKHCQVEVIIVSVHKIITAKLVKAVRQNRISFSSIRFVSFRIHDIWYSKS